MQDVVYRDRNLEELLLDHGPAGRSNGEETRRDEHRLHSSCEGREGQRAFLFTAKMSTETQCRSDDSGHLFSSPAQDRRKVLLGSLIPSSLVHEPKAVAGRFSQREGRTCALPQRSRAGSRRHAPVDIVLATAVGVQRRVEPVVNERCRNEREVSSLDSLKPSKKTQRTHPALQHCCP